jgi:hypothetical protein
MSDLNQELSELGHFPSHKVFREERAGQIIEMTIFPHPEDFLKQPLACKGISAAFDADQTNRRL